MAHFLAIVSHFPPLYSAQSEAKWDIVDTRKRAPTEAGTRSHSTEEISW